MKHSITRFFVLSALLIQVWSCEKDNSEILVPQGNVQHTSLVYLVADNNLASYAATDIEEMIEGYAEVQASEESTLLVYIDDKEEPRLLHIKKENNEVLAETIQTYPEQNSVEVEVMSSVIKEAFIEFPAESYGLVLWSHADGWLPGTDLGNTISSKSFGEDSNNWSSSGARMDILDLKAALQGSPTLEYLIFDACDMQAVEVAYELRHLTENIIASPVEISAYGGPYQAMVPAFFSGPHPSEAIAAAFFGEYRDTYKYSSGTPDASKGSGHINTIGKGSHSVYPYGIAISVIKTEGLDRLATATRAIFEQDKVGNATVETEGILSYDNNYYNFYYDLSGFVHSIAEPGSAELQAWEEIYAEVVPLFLTTPYTYSSFAENGRGGIRSMESATGVSTFIPGNQNFSKARHWGSYLEEKPDAPKIVEDYYSYYQQYYKNYEWYHASGWGELLGDSL